MAFTPLAPSANDRAVTFTVPKEIDPYLVELFIETKLEGEGVNGFLLRHLKILARNHQNQKANNEAVAAMRDSAMQTPLDTAFIIE